MDSDEDQDVVAGLLDLRDSFSSSQSHSSSDTAPPVRDLFGYVIAKIVGNRHYSVAITGDEMVGLIREPLNPDDQNAIKVLNTRSLQVGHIENSVASVLSPLIDARKVNLEGIMLNSGSACRINVFARFEDFDLVKSCFDSGELLLISERNAVEVKEMNKKGRLKNKEEIFKLVDENLSKKGELGTLEPPKELIITELFLHQKEGLWWLMHRENSDDLPPFWEEKDGVFINVLTNYHGNQRPEPLRGGIFADDMGLGKTLTLLSLIAFDKVDRSNISDRRTCEVEEDSSFDGKKGERARSGEGKAGRKKQKTIDNSLDDLLVNKTTLIVCPPAVWSTWVSQLEEHTKRGSFKTYLYYGERTKEAQELRNKDIVLTTYSTLASEESWEDSPIKMIEWWRVILDEAHNIKNANAQQSQAVTNLKAERRWVVTGTPIQNGSFDLFSYMAFLRLAPFSIKSYWQNLVQRPLYRGDDKAVSRLQVLMATISLRRTKDKVLLVLPSKTVETHLIELSGEERELYDQMEREAKGVIQGFINAGSLDRNYSTMLCVILRLRQICNDITLCPSHLRNLLPSNSIEEVSNNHELLQKVVAVLKDGEDFNCPICISVPTDTVITQCGHIFCRSCILKAMQCLKYECPICRRSLSISDLFSAPPESSQSENKETFSSRNISSKVAQLLKLLNEARDRNPNAKSVIFSQFQKMLILLEEPLKEAGFKILRLDGSMNVKKRDQVIKEFGVAAPEGPTLLLASLKASGAGINLTMASTVYLMEPWWNPAVEEQAMNRVHRIGQKEDVTIVRLIARNSIEERVLEMQERKKKLAMEALGPGGAKAGTVGVDDLRTLVSL